MIGLSVLWFIYLRSDWGDAVLRVVAVLLMLVGVGIAATGLFFLWMSGFASPLGKEMVIVLSSVGIVSGLVAIVGGVFVWRKSRRSSS